jgi:hypothetical protein
VAFALRAARPSCSATFEARTADEVDVFVLRIADGLVKRLGIKDRTRAT